MPVFELSGRLCSLEHSRELGALPSCWTWVLQPDISLVSWWNLGTEQPVLPNSPDFQGKEIHWCSPEENFGLGPCCSFPGNLGTAPAVQPGVTLRARQGSVQCSPTQKMSFPNLETFLLVLSEQSMSFLKYDSFPSLSVGPFPNNGKEGPYFQIICEGSNSAI